MSRRRKALGIRAPPKSLGGPRWKHPERKGVRRVQRSAKGGRPTPQPALPGVYGFGVPDFCAFEPTEYGAISTLCVGPRIRGLVLGFTADAYAEKQVDGGAGGSRKRVLSGPSSFSVIMRKISPLTGRE